MQRNQRKITFNAPVNRQLLVFFVNLQVAPRYTYIKNQIFTTPCCLLGYTDRVHRKYKIIRKHAFYYRVQKGNTYVYTYMISREFTFSSMNQSHKKSADSFFSQERRLTIDKRK